MRLFNLIQRFIDNHNSIEAPELEANLKQGIHHYNSGNLERAKQEFMKGALYGLEYPCKYYNTLYSDVVGQCFTFLLTKFRTNDSIATYNASFLAYNYLSSAISLIPRDAWDSYESRGNLLINHTNKQIMNNLRYDYNPNNDVYPLLICDNYFAALPKNSPHKESMNYANTVYKMSNVAGTIKDVALIGENMHKYMFTQIEKLYAEKKFNMSIDDLNSIFL